MSSIASGVGHMCAVTDTGGLECWGWNYYGQLGVGTDTGPNVCGYGDTYPIGCAVYPTVVKGLGSGVSAVAAGYASMCALTSAGAVKCWGYNAVGALGNGTTEGPEGCGEYPIACSTMPVPVTGLGSGVSAISAGWEHACALLDTGNVKCWGSNGDGTLGDGTTTDSSTPVTVQLPSGVKVTEIATGGGYQTCALTSEGSVLCWGSNATGQLGDGSYSGPQQCEEEEVPCSTVPVEAQLPAGVKATAVTVGAAHTCALTSEGSAYCWGYNRDGELGDGTTTETTTPVEVLLPEGVKATAISSKNYDTCVVTSEGGIYCWGENFSGQLGDGTDEGPEECSFSENWCSTKPVAVSGLGEAATSVAVGETYACALMRAGGVECWGYERNGALGDGLAGQLVPAHVLELMWSLSVSTSGPGSGTVYSSPSGIYCGSGFLSCGGLFAPYASVTLHAAPDTGSVLIGLTGAGCGGSGSTCQLGMSEARSATATFALAPSASISAPAGGGAYTVDQPVSTSFSCSEGEGGPGLSSCNDSTGAGTASGGSGQLDTSTPGNHTYTVTATSKDGAKASQSISYTVTTPTPEGGTNTTPAPPATSTSNTTPPPSKAFAPLTVKLASTRASVRAKRTTVELSCAGGAPDSACYGILSLTSRERVTRRVHGQRRTSLETVVLASAHYTIASGRKGAVALRLTEAGAKLLARDARLHAQASATTLGEGHSAHGAIFLARVNASSSSL